MNTTQDLFANLAAHLRIYLQLCEEMQGLSADEKEALAGAADYRPSEYVSRRKSLLARMDHALILLRPLRQAWQRLELAERENLEIKSLLQTVQDSMVKTLMLDRENQRAMLRRGLVPAVHLGSFSSPSPRQAASIYRQYSDSATGRGDHHHGSCCPTPLADSESLLLS